jgi:Domain of unknown function (DUF4868)
VTQAEQPTPRRDDAVASLTTVAQLAAGEVATVMLMTRQADGLLDFWQLRPTPSAVSVLNEVARNAATRYAASEVIDYEPSALTSGPQVMWLPVTNVPMLQSIADEVGDLANIDIFDPARANLGRLRLAAMRVTNNAASGVFLESVSPGQVIAQSRNRLGLLVRRGTIDTPPQGNLLLFTRTIAAVIVGDVVLFSDRPVFQRLFGYLEEMQQRATETFLAVTAGLQIEGIEAMGDVVTRSPAMLGKMASIQRRLDTYPQYKAAYTMPKLVDFVNRHPQCQVEISGSGEDARLVFNNDAQHRFKILKLLDDDYLRSELTQLDYDANSKSAPFVDPA